MKTLISLLSIFSLSVAPVISTGQTLSAANLFASLAVMAIFGIAIADSGRTRRPLNVGRTIRFPDAAKTDTGRRSTHGLAA